ncbi:hypothetical protein TRFO_28120 [Tritrichomonas foetus]|uniref:Uncharacterized protein n=1 Tax=Tritrichomonas foetus TaxID=1144522 RepID=A0A1J4JYX8_9EUKA|nr:hypothetical protein TRFO_28120 [Tritrichomonas foetus]|eukprot:OHT04361.1 hypothetical protein TRFO_28120 [Tritrichomonas foetus]
MTHLIISSLVKLLNNYGNERNQTLNHVQTHQNTYENVIGISEVDDSRKVKNNDIINHLNMKYSHNISQISQNSYPVNSDSTNNNERIVGKDSSDVAQISNRINNCQKQENNSNNHVLIIPKNANSIDTPYKNSLMSPNERNYSISSLLVESEKRENFEKLHFSSENHSKENSIDYRTNPNQPNDTNLSKNNNIFINIQNSHNKPSDDSENENQFNNNQIHDLKLEVSFKNQNTIKNSQKNKNRNLNLTQNQNLNQILNQNQNQNLNLNQNQNLNQILNQNQNQNLNLNQNQNLNQILNQNQNQNLNLNQNQNLNQILNQNQNQNLNLNQNQNLNQNLNLNQNHSHISLSMKEDELNILLQPKRKRGRPRKVNPIQPWQQIQMPVQQIPIIPPVNATSLDESISWNFLCTFFGRRVKFPALMRLIDEIKSVKLIPFTKTKNMRKIDLVKWLDDHWQVVYPFLQSMSPENKRDLLEFVSD